jgi:hypothetical protein
MSSNVWKPSQAGPFFEKGWKRANQESWEARWLELGVEARSAFLRAVKVPANKVNRTPVSVAADHLLPNLLRELTAARFVEVRPGAGPPRVFAAGDVLDFSSRLQAAHRYHLLAADQPSELEAYAKFCFAQDGLFRLLEGILRAHEVDPLYRLEEMLERYVARGRWIDWVLRRLNDPMAERLVDLVQEASHPLPLAGLAARIKGSDPTVVRAALNDLVTHLVLFEDLHPDTWELVVGLLPSVRQERLAAQQPRQRPPLQVCPTPREVGPEGGFAVNDLLAFLLELAGEPPRLRRDQTLFQKELERFQQVLESLPAWLSAALHAQPAQRLDRALWWARHLQLVTKGSKNGESRLCLSPRGQGWLTTGPEAQYAHVYEFLRATPSLNDAYPFFAPADSRYLGADVTAVPSAKARATAWDVKPAHRQALRDAVAQSLNALPLGVFHTLDSFLAHAAFGEHNPLLLGQTLHEVAVFRHGRRVPPFEEEVEEAGRASLRDVCCERLIPLGCVRTGLDGQGRLCIARLPRLDSYFGREPVSPALAAEPQASRVVVQPDFSIIVIGPNPAPVAELAPFCERAQGHPGQGAFVFKLTREAVIKAVSHGLEGAEILARLQRHASAALPANLVREVREWCDWVRPVQTSTLTVIRCPDRGTADRVAAALGRQAERLNDTLVGIPEASLSTADRKKLQQHGLVVHGPAQTHDRVTTGRKKRRSD